MSKNRVHALVLVLAVVAVALTVVVVAMFVRRLDADAGAATSGIGGAMRNVEGYITRKTSLDDAGVGLQGPQQRALSW